MALIPFGADNIFQDGLNSNREFNWAQTAPNNQCLF
ncbi:hypothetical protein N836_06695 [Leptolyngbya sp. Heron Island J]|nr:hypothetical protein N836_06695 [Leptolyngbya sp. Heron Island J]